MWHPRRIRFGMRAMLAAIAGCALLLTGAKIAWEGPETHWLLWKLKFGDVAARQAAAAELLYSSAEYALATPSIARDGQARNRLAIPALSAASNDRDSGVRLQCVQSLRAIASVYGSPVQYDDAARAIVARARDADRVVRIEAITALGAFAKCPEIVLEPAVESLGDRDPEIRSAATRGLAAISSENEATLPIVLPTLLDRLQHDENGSVRARASFALRQIVRQTRASRPLIAQSVIPALIAAFGDRDVEVRRGVARGFGSLGWRPFAAQARPMLIAALADFDPDVQFEAAYSLAWLDTVNDRILSILRERAKDSSNRSQFRAEMALEHVQAIGKLGAE